MVGLRSTSVHRIELRFAHMDDAYERTLLQVAEQIKTELPGTEVKASIDTGEFVDLEPRKLTRYLYPEYIMAINCPERAVSKLMEEVLPRLLKPFQRPVAITAWKNGKEAPFSPIK